MRNPILALDVDLAIAARGRAALREQLGEFAERSEDPLERQLVTIALLLGDR